MSSKNYTTYLQPKDGQGRVDVIKFIDCIVKHDWASLGDYFGEKLKGFTGYSGHDLENRLTFEKRMSDLINNLNFSEKDGVFRLDYETSGLFDEESFAYFLLGIGAERTESVCDDSGCGEVGYLLDGEFYDSYEDCEWLWVKEPISLSEKNIVFTGKLAGGTREEMASLAEDAGAIVQKEVNKKTDFLIIGADVGDKKINKAKELGVTVITENEFLLAVREFT